MQKPRIIAPRKQLFFLLTLAVLSLSACDVFERLAEADKSLIEQVQGSQAQFTPLGDGLRLPVINRGIKEQELVFLTAYKGSVRWNRSEDSFESFGGELPLLANAGEIYADTQGDLHFYDRSESLYVFTSGSTAWQVQAFKDILPDEIKTSLRPVWAVGNTGEEVAAVQKLGTQTYHFVKRQRANENFKPWFQWDFKQDDFALGSVDEFHLQPNGDVLMTNTSPFKPFIIEAGTQKPVPLFECSQLISKYCAALTILRGNGHGNIYAVTPGDGKTQVYKTSDKASFPAVPETLPVLEHLGKTADILLDPRGELFAIVTEKDAETIPVAPFVRDVSTLMQLQGSRWVTKKTFYPPPGSWFIGPDNALYSSGFQLAAGGNFVGESVYRLGF